MMNGHVLRSLFVVEAEGAIDDGVVTIGLGDVVGVVGVVVGGSVVDAVGDSGAESSCCGLTPVYEAFGAPRPGVGSNINHPIPSNQTSGHAWACWLRTM